MKFVVDSMLGKLARWLRLLGYDTLYFNRKNDAELLDIAMREGRILLTRDTKLARNFSAKSLLIKSLYIEEQLKQVIEWFYLSTKYAFTRCSLCNDLLLPMSREDITRDGLKDKLPSLVYQTYEEFYLCKVCDKLYWMGDHFKNIKNKINNFKT